MATPFEVELERQKREVSDSQERARQAEELYRFFAKHRHIKPIDANRSILKSYFGDRPQDLSVAALEIALTNPQIADSLAVYKSDDDLRGKLTEDIRASLVGSPQSIEYTINSLRYLDTPALQEKRDELKRRQASRSQSAAELRAQLEGTNISVPPLPDNYDKATIIKMEPAALRKLTQIYTLSAVNRRIQGRG